MNANVLTAAISAGAAVITAAIALLVNHRAFGLLDSRINGLAQDLREMRSDLKEFFRIQADFDKRLGRIEDKLGIPPR